MIKNNEKRNNHTTKKHRSYYYAKNVSQRDKNSTDDDFSQTNLQNYIKQLAEAKNANISAYKLNQLKVRLLKEIKPPTSSWLYKANYDLLQNKIEKQNNFVDDIRELKNNVSKTRQIRRFLSLFDEISLKLKENIMLLEQRLSVLEVRNLQKNMDKYFDNIYLKFDNVEKLFEASHLENKAECKIFKENIDRKSEDIFQEFELVKKSNKKQEKVLYEIHSNKLEQLNEKMTNLVEITPQNQSLNDAQYAILIDKLEQQQISKEILDLIKDKKPLEMKKVIEDALAKGIISNKESQKAIESLKEHTTVCKNEIMFDIVDVLSDAIKWIIGKKEINSFIDNIKGARIFIFSYKRYLNIVLNILIVTSFGAILGGYISSKYFSQATDKSLKHIFTQTKDNDKSLKHIFTQTKDNNKSLKRIFIQTKDNVKSLKHIFTQTKENNKSLNFLKNNIQKKVSYELVDSCSIPFKKHSAILNDEKKIIEKCEKQSSIIKAYVIGYANNVAFIEGTNKNYDDNFDLSLARANAIKILLYKKCKYINIIDVVNIVTESEDSKDFLKADIRFYKQKEMSYD